MRARALELLRRCGDAGDPPRPGRGLGETAPAAADLEHADLGAAPWFPAGLDGVSWRALVPGIRHFRFSGVDSGGGTVRLLAIAPGTALPHHGHGGTELTPVLSGSFADETGRFQAGDLADLAPSAQHQPVADTDTPCISPDRHRRAGCASPGVLGRLFQPLVGI